MRAQEAQSSRAGSPDAICDAAPNSIDCACHCGEVLLPGANFCGMCGTSRSSLEARKPFSERANNLCDSVALFVIVMEINV